PSRMAGHSPPGRRMQGSTELSIIHPRVLESADTCRAEFTSAAPFPHVVIDDFLAPDFAAALLGNFPAFERGNAVGDDGKPGGKPTGIEGLIYDPWYLGGGTHENRDGMSLDPHVDFNYHPSERWHRRLNLIVYLNPQWEESWGGCLELFRDPHADARPARSVAPAFNRCVIFETSERSWHAFDRITLPPEHAALTRRSIALYFYTKDRPAAETAPRHTTYYVSRQLPPHLDEGRTLTRGDVAEIRQLI